MKLFLSEIFIRWFFIMREREREREREGERGGREREREGGGREGEIKKETVVFCSIFW